MNQAKYLAITFIVSSGITLDIGLTGTGIALGIVGACAGIVACVEWMGS